MKHDSNYTKPEILTDLSIIMMDKFIECLIYHKYHCLIVRGKPSEKELTEAWEGIWDEYCILSNQNNYKTVVMHLQSIALFERKILLIEMCLIILSRQYNETVIEILRKKLGFNYKFDINNPEEYIRDLQTVQRRKKNIEFSLSLEQTNYKNLVNKNKNNDITKKDFDTIFVSLNKHMKYGFKITPMNTSVSEYCAMINTLK